MKLYVFGALSILLLSSFISGSLYDLYIRQTVHIATDDELLIISRESPYAAEEFRNALAPSGDSISKPLTIRDAHNLASECTARDEQNGLREKQLKALNEFPPDKKGQQ
ncbi:hypothetical protein N5I81_027715 [Klebsiella michiganensis]|uniref:hypothetical protein n=1 Tax=Klebsiella michiganensis TaxID=1134687 RepID=UPI002245D3B8|nr:hypothetical protein [Klebsiella michiganensis]MCW9340926.1 hypothetical protein [Klebsiella michiganensis]